MSPADPNLLDSYPDESWDDPEEPDELHHIQVVHPEDLFEPERAETSPVPTVDHTEEEVQDMVTRRNPRTRAVEEVPYEIIERGPDTVVISGPCTSEGAIRGIPGSLRTRPEAREWTLEKHGTIIEEILIPHRWAFRIWKPGVKRK